VTSTASLLKPLLNAIMFLASVGMLAALFAWIPFAPIRLRHAVRHWGLVVDDGCPRCARHRGRIAAERGAEQAFVALSRRILARVAFGKVAAL
jgi:hypothetical protein